MAAPEPKTKDELLAEVRAERIAQGLPPQLPQDAWNRVAAMFELPAKGDESERRPA